MGARIEAEPALRSAAAALLAARGLCIDDEPPPMDGAAPENEADGGLLAADGRRVWSGKRVVRMLLDRSVGAQVRTNPIHRDEAFACAHCGADVLPGGAPVRDHCPRCLRSLHVDNVPGDRAAGCGGVLDPVALQLESGGVRVISHRCRRCGADRRVRAHPDDVWPPSMNPGDLPPAAAPGPGVAPA